MLCLSEVKTRSRSENSSSESVGFAKYVLSFSPTFKDATGPFQGMLEVASAADAPTIARVAGSFSPSTDSTIAITWTSFLKDLGNKGRIERSIRREVRISSSDGLPSLFIH